MLMEKKKRGLLVVDDLNNGHPFWCASLMIHVNLEGIVACLVTLKWSVQAKLIFELAYKQAILQCA